jgi:hypothetical protein
MAEDENQNVVPGSDRQTHIIPYLPPPFYGWRPLPPKKEEPKEPPRRRDLTSWPPPDYNPDED